MTRPDESTTSEQAIRPDGGTETAGGTSEQPDAATIHEQTDYLEAEVNILRPSTPFMRDHLRLIWIGFLAWALVIFGPVTATYLFQDAMTGATFLGFPLHYFLVAVGAPGGALVLSAIYSWRRDKLDEKYGIDHSRQTRSASADGAGPEPVADGGDDEQVTDNTEVNES